uniref:Macaca fascicularis brain cDNA clone: QflA-23033, similar to human hypothetical protein FLJ20315 (FLJ20315), mRNA, RefSeq: NM_017763.1 n=1 Tax=Macaca fascicularis TaxID=9541 RepID=I7GIV9_MACFA|nr:unnamed protein product [Macaca fascicularis]
MRLGPTWHRVLLPGEERTTANTILFAILPRSTGRGLVMMEGGRVPFPAPAPDLVCRTHLQCSKSMSSQATSCCLWRVCAGSLEGRKLAMGSQVLQRCCSFPEPYLVSLTPGLMFIPASGFSRTHDTLSPPSSGELCTPALAPPQ